MAENGCHSHIQINKITVKSSELMNMNAMLIPFFRSQEKSVLLHVWKTQKVNRFATRCGKDRIFRTKAAFSRKHRLAVRVWERKKNGTVDSPISVKKQSKTGETTERRRQFQTNTVQSVKNVIRLSPTRKRVFRKAAQFFITELTQAETAGRSTRTDQ